MHATPLEKDLVLIGGGHAHVGVLAWLRMHPLPGVRVTLIARDIETPYSGMLPGFIAGHYSREQCHIDLRPLARLANVRLVHDAATGLDLVAKRVTLRGRPPIPYDVLSIDIGSTPSLACVPGAAAHAIPVKPIDQLAARWMRIVDEVGLQDGPRRFLTAGGGAAGVEVTLAMRHRLRTLLTALGRDADALSFTLVTSGEILAGQPAGARAWFRNYLQSCGVRLVEQNPITEVAGGVAITRDGTRFAYDRLLWMTEACGAPWLTGTGLQLDEAGFIKVDASLRAIGTDCVFAAGDIAANVDHPRPKAGVFAVRQGMPLADNLARALAGKPLRPFVPQLRFLSLISTGERTAVGARGRLWAHGAWLWRLKDRIDRAWMQRYQNPAPMTASAPLPLLANDTADMRCGGCGAKVGADVLSRVMARLAPARGADVVLGLDAPDDAAVVKPPADKLLLQTVDHFRAFIDDGYVLGRIAANHALCDIYAMGGSPWTVLALAALPHGAATIVEDELYQMMRGALDVIEEAGATLTGGHTSEAEEVAIGFAVTGLASQSELLTKSGMLAGDKLILTKALGTGALLAADMRTRAKGPWIDAALATMQRSSRDAVPILRAHGVHALTDVTGFGLAGHLIEMLTASRCDCTLDLDAVAALAGALEVIAQGFASTLAPANARLAHMFSDHERLSPLPRFQLLFDPQTSGGLLASVPAANAEACVAELRTRGYPDARIIGEVTPQAGPAPRVITGR